jgi:hypothetical protein
MLIWLVVAVNAAFAAYGAMTFEAGPNDVAAHGMVPADLQIKLLGFMLLFPALMGVVWAVVSLPLLLRGARWALYAACVPGVGLVQWCFTLLSIPTATFSWWVGGTVLASVLVLGSAVADALRRPLDGLAPWLPWATLRALLPVILLELGVIPLIGYAALRSKQASDVQQAGVRRAKEAEQRREAEAAAARAQEAKARERQIQADLEAERSPQWNQYASPIIDVALDFAGRSAATVHENGKIAVWGSAPAPGAISSDHPNRLAREYGPIVGAERVHFGFLRAILSQSGSSLEAWRSWSGAQSSSETIRHCAEREPRVLFDVLGDRRVAVAGKALCLVDYGAAAPVRLHVPQCPRITGLHASSDGELLLIECPRRVAVFDTSTKRILAQAGTPQLIPGSARFLGPSYAGITKEGDEYVAVIGKLEPPGPVKRVPLGGSTVPPQLEYLGRARLVVAGAGVCVHGPGERVDCPVPRDQPVKRLAIAGRFTRFIPGPRTDFNSPVQDQFVDALVLFAGEQRLERVTLH